MDFGHDDPHSSSRVSRANHERGPAPSTSLSWSEGSYTQKKDSWTLRNKGRSLLLCVLTPQHTSAKQLCSLQTGCARASLSPVPRVLSPLPGHESTSLVGSGRASGPGHVTGTAERPWCPSMWAALPCLPRPTNPQSMCDQLREAAGAEMWGSQDPDEATCSLLTIPSASFFERQTDRQTERPSAGSPQMPTMSRARPG